MAFDLGMLGSMVRGGGGAPAPSHGAGPGPLQELGRMKISQGYLDLQRGQEERLKAEHAYAQLEGEKKTRQAAIDAWLGAVRSGNRADIWVLGKRLKSMGINVQMPDAFSASGIPSEAEAPPDDELGFTLEERSKNEKLGKEIEARGKAITDELQGPAQGRAAEPFKPTRPDGTPISPGIAQGALQGIQPLEFGAPPAVNPFGPGGPTAIKPPTNTWRVSDPVTGTDLEIAPEQILADQEREIDQAFLPLVRMEGLDPIAARGYQIGHEFAKGQIGFKTPAEATKAGMDAADRYMNHMYKKGILDIQALKAARRAGGGGAAGGGGGGAPAGKSRIELAREAADVNTADKISRGVRETVKTVYAHENYKLVSNEMNKLVRAVGSLNTKTSLGERTSFRQLMTAVEQRLSNADAEYYQQSGGLLSRLNQALNYVAGGGELSDTQIREVRALTQQLQNDFSKRQRMVQRQGAEAGSAYLDAFNLSPEQRTVFDSQVHTLTGSSGSSGGGEKKSGRSLLEKAK